MTYSVRITLINLLPLFLTLRYDVGAFQSFSQSKCSHHRFIRPRVDDDDRPSLSPINLALNHRQLHIIDSNFKSIDPLDNSPLQLSRRKWIVDTTSSAIFTFGVAVWGRRPLPATAAGTVTTISPAPQVVTSTTLCNPSVSAWRNSSNNRLVYILGTAHISSDSAQLAGQLVRDIRPEAVFVELDAKRVSRALPSKSDPTSDQIRDTSEPSSVIALTDGANESLTPSLSSQKQQKTASSSSTGMFDLREKAVRFSSQLLGDAIKGLYKKLESEGFSAGEEFVIAVREGQKIGSKIILGDRDVEYTLRRLSEALAQTDLKKLLSDNSELEQSMKKLLPENLRDVPSNEAILGKEELSQFVETMKAKENVKMIMANLKAVAPELHRALVAERDEFMAMGLHSLNQFGTIVAVMGIAHVDGVEQNLLSKGWVPIKLPCSSILS